MILNNDTDKLREEFARSQQFAQERLAKPFREYVIEILQSFVAATREFPEVKAYFSDGGPSFSDMLKAVQDDSEEGRQIVEMFRKRTEMDLAAKGVHSDQVLKPLVKWE